MDPVYRGWMGLAAAISKVTTPVVMGVLYFLVLTPIGLLLRAFGHRPLAPSRGVSSAWIPREHGAGRAQRSDSINSERHIMTNASLPKELWAFLRVRKKWWLLPIIIVMLLVGTLLVFAQGSALAPFIYTIF